jgi:Uncharacterized conserved protein
MIEKILLRNFKCFELQNLTLNGLTILTGLNGMGKSSVLQALLLLRQSYLDGLLPKIGLALNGTLVKMGTAKDVLYENAQSDNFDISIGWDDKINAQFTIQYNREADVLKINPTTFAPQIFERIPFTDNFHYLQAERLGPRTTNVLSDYQVREHRQLGTAGEYVEHFLHMFGDKVIKDSKLYKNELLPRDLKSQVQAWLNEISPGIELQLAIHNEMDIINLQYSFIAGKQRSNAYRSTSVGFGITYILPVLVALLSSSAGNLVMIENPEAHLHPRGQFIIGELLARAASAGIQVIVETHSDHVLNGIRVSVHDGIIKPEDVTIHYFSKIEEEGHMRSKVNSIVVDKDGRLDQWPEGFFDEWDKSLGRLLEPGS